MTIVRVSTPSRLHFGLLRVHESPTLSYGGLGMMIDQPRVELEAATADAWRSCGPDADRAEKSARKAVDALPGASKPRAMRLRVTASIPPHRGLGAGTQLALAAAAAVRRLAGLPPGTAAELAAMVDRGRRSAVGSHGFVHGGLIWERGRAVGETLAELTARVVVPGDWRIVLVAPRCAQGLCGGVEHSAFAALPQVPEAVTNRLLLLAEEQILPAADGRDLAAFGEAVYEYGRISGQCFAAIQGGPFASPAVEQCVEAIRHAGVRGVGQSSWGPTVFAITEDHAAARDLVARLQADPRWADHELRVAVPDHRGAVVSVGDAPLQQPVGRQRAP